MSRPRPRVCDLTPEELELLALEHIESMFIELRATSAVFREQYHPVKLIKRHPFVAAGLAAAAAFMLARYVQRKPAGSSGEKATAAAPRLLDSLLSGAAGAAGSALPELVASWLGQGSKQD
jgi:hypothetical protein